MIDYDVALARLLEGVVAGPVETVSASTALGRVLAAPVISAEALPPFDNSAMDGFALQVPLPGAAAGAEFDVGGEAAAGDGVSRMRELHAMEIMTGAPVPEGCTAVVPVERVDVLAADASGRARRIRLQELVTTGQHVRRAGHDVAMDSVLAAAGTRVDASLQMLFAAAGVADLDVHACPRVALLNTGRELVDDASQPLVSGQIRNCNGPFLAARLASAGATVVMRETLGDDIDAFVAALDRAHLADTGIVVSTGAVSMGRYDFIPEALARVGAQVLFHKVRIRPGKPILAARLRSGALFVGLPGNPASSAVGLRFFVEPVIRALLGMPPEAPLQLPLLHAFENRSSLRMLLKARVRCDASGRVGVEVIDGQESFRVRPLFEANAWAVVPHDTQSLAAGDRVQVAGRGHLQPVELVA